MMTPGSDALVLQHQPRAELRGNNVLYTRCAKVPEDQFGSPKLEGLVSRMTDVMHETAGIGIAANQCHMPLQVFVIEFEASNPRYAGLGFADVPLQIFVNPRIVSASPECRSFWHGCLSCQGEKRGEVITYEKIGVEYRTVEGIQREEELSGMAAVIFQHELRHLLGGTYLDRAVSDRLVSLENLVEAFNSGKETRSRVLSSCEEAEGEEKKTGENESKSQNGLPHLIGDYKIGETLEEFYERTGVPESEQKWIWTTEEENTKLGGT